MTKVKLAIHQDRAIERTRERTREREIKHIATGTYPQPRGWTTPSLSWKSPGWWRWPPVMGSPSGRVPERAPERFLVATEACGGRTPDLFFSPMFLGYMDLYRRKKSVRGATRGPQGWGARLPASWLPRSFSDVYSKSPGLLPFQK